MFGKDYANQFNADVNNFIRIILINITISYSWFSGSQIMYKWKYDRIPQS